MSALDHLKQGMQTANLMLRYAYKHSFPALREMQPTFPREDIRNSPPTPEVFSLNFLQRVADNYRFFTDKYFPLGSEPARQILKKSFQLRNKISQRIKHLEKAPAYFHKIPSIVNSIFATNLQSIFPGLFDRHDVLPLLNVDALGSCAEEDRTDPKASSYYQMSVFKKVSRGVRSAGREVRRSARKTARVVRHAGRNTRQWVKDHPTETAVIVVGVAAIVTGGILAAAGAPAAGAATASLGAGATGGAANQAQRQPRKNNEEKEQPKKISAPPPPPINPPKMSPPPTPQVITPTISFVPSHPNPAYIPPEYRIPEVEPSLKNVIAPIEPRYVPPSRPVQAPTHHIQLPITRMEPQRTGVPAAELSPHTNPQIKSPEPPTFAAQLLEKAVEMEAQGTHAICKYTGVLVNNTLQRAEDLLPIAEVVIPTISPIARQIKQAHLRELWGKVMPTVHEKIDKIYSTNLRYHFDPKNDGEIERIVQDLVLDPFNALAAVPLKAVTVAAEVAPAGGKLFGAAEKTLTQEALTITRQIATAEKAAAAEVSITTTAEKLAVAEREIAYNRAAFEEYKTVLRAEMEKPVVTDPKLKRMVDKIYRPKADVGSGSTAAAIRVEKATGERVKGKQHSQKGKDRLIQFENWLKNNPNASLGDRAAAENIIKDLKNALE